MKQQLKKNALAGQLCRSALKSAKWIAGSLFLASGVAGCSKQTLEVEEPVKLELSTINRDYYQTFSNVIKKGACFSTKPDAAWNTSDPNGWVSIVNNLNVGWNYTWAEQLKSTRPTSEFVPMVWGQGDIDTKVSYLKGLAANGQIKYVLGFNEPDLTSQSNMTPEKAIELWPKLESIGVPLGSPAIAGPSQGNGPDGWLYRFMTLAKQQKRRVDFVCVHYYPGTNVGDFVNKMKILYENYGLPIWVTEMATANSARPGGYTAAEVKTFMEGLLPALDALPYVHRYAWFSARVSSSNLGPSALCQDNGTLTTLGTVYKNWASTTPNANAPVIVYKTTPDRFKQFFREPNLVKSSSVSITDEISVNYASTAAAQTYRGAGVNLTGSSAVLLSQLPVQTRDSLLTELFSPTDGMGVNMVRVSIAASDFSTQDYSYRTTETAAFDLVKIDDQQVIPILQKIKTINPGVKVIATPYSAPYWMKASNQFKGSSNQSLNRLKTDYLDDYANYLLTYLEKMKQNGIDVDYMTLQNEPTTHSTAYPTMLMPASDAGGKGQIDLINMLAPMINASSALTVKTKILAGDVNWSDASYISTIFGNATAKGHAGGAAFHSYSGDPVNMENLRVSHAKEMFVTQYADYKTSAYNNQTWFNEKLGPLAKDQLIASFRNGASAYLFYNLALDQNSEPNNRGASNSVSLVTINNGKVEKNPEFYLLGHFSKFIKPGAKKYPSSSVSGTGLHHVAFKNSGDNWKTVVVYNSTTSKKVVKVNAGSTDNFTYLVMDGGSVVSFNWP